MKPQFIGKQLTSCPACAYALLVSSPNPLSNPTAYQFLIERMEVLCSHQQYKHVRVYEDHILLPFGSTAINNVTEKQKLEFISKNNSLTLVYEDILKQACWSTMSY